MSVWTGTDERSESGGEKRERERERGDECVARCVRGF